MRAKALGFGRELKTARLLATIALARAEAAAKRTGASEWRHHLKAQEEAEKNYRAKDRPRQIGPFARDPLYGYSMGQTEAERLIQGLDLSKITRNLEILRKDIPDAELDVRSL